MKNKALTLAIAAALSAPASFAATDQSGMRYTSAAEGLYGFVNMRFQTKSSKGGKAGYSNSDTAVRLGVRGTNDMGHGLEGFYRWEVERSANDGSGAGVDNRLGNAGIRGAFGEVVMGSFWTADLNWIGAITDTAGADTYYTDEREGRSQEAFQYTTPDLNGFAGAARFSFGDRNDNQGGKNSDKTLNLWNLAAKYEVAGFHIGASYNVIPSGGIAAGSGPVCPGTTSLRAKLTATNAYALNMANGEIEGGGYNLTGLCATPNASAAPNAGVVDGLAPSSVSDTKSWNLGLKYAQDNWFVGGVYGVDNTSDNDLGVATSSSRKGCGARGDSTRAAGSHVARKCEDTKRIGLSAGVTIDKINLSASWQKDELMDGAEETTGGIEAVYNFSSQSRVLANYRLQDRDSDKDADNHLRLELRHSF